MSERASDVPLPGGDFRLFVTRLGVQAMFALGLLENPVTGATQSNPAQARMLRDDLRMLLAKTEGNLDDSELEHLQSVLSDIERRLDD